MKKGITKYLRNTFSKFLVRPKEYPFFVSVAKNILGALRCFAKLGSIQKSGEGLPGVPKSGLIPKELKRLKKIKSS